MYCAYDILRPNPRFCQQMSNPVRILEDPFLYRRARGDIESSESKRLASWTFRYLSSDVPDYADPGFHQSGSVLVPVAGLNRYE